MNQPQIKKYFRRVSDDYVNKILGKLDPIDYFSASQVRKILEADADVIEVRNGHECYYGRLPIWLKYPVGSEQFHAEWEEIQC